MEQFPLTEILTYGLSPSLTATLAVLWVKVKTLEKRTDNASDIVRDLRLKLAAKFGETF